MPEEFAGSAPKMTGMYPVPVYWTKYAGLNLPSKGDATYRLLVDTESEYELIGISTPELYTEYALYVNGQLLVGNGKLGGTSFRYLDPDVFMFEPGSDRIEIVLQIHNHTHVNAGIGQSIILERRKKFSGRILWKRRRFVLVGICCSPGSTTLYCIYTTGGV